MSRNTSRKTVHLQLETELLDQVDALAKRQARSRLNLIRWLVLRGLKRYAEIHPPTREASSGGEGATAGA